MIELDIELTAISINFVFCFYRLISAKDKCKTDAKVLIVINFEKCVVRAQ